MLGLEVEAMAPLNNRSVPAGRRRTRDVLQSSTLSDVQRRQEGGGNNGDGGDRDRSRFGGNNGGDGNGDGRSFRGGGFGGGNNNNGDGNGSNRGDGNGRGDGGRGGFGNRFGNGDRDRSGGDGRGGGDGNRFGSGFGDGRGNGNGFGNGKGFGNGDGGRGDGRFRGGFGRGGNDNNGGGENDAASDNADESSAPSSSSEPAPTAPADPPPSSSVEAPTATEAASTSNPGVVVLQSAVTGSPAAEENPTVTEFIPLMTASDAAGSTNPSEADVNVDAVDASSGVLPSGPAQTPVPGNPPTGGPMDNSNPTSTGAGGGAGTRVEISQGGMDPTAERILISVGSIGGFVLLAFVIWMVWRSMRKSKKAGNASNTPGGPLRGIASRIPFFRRRKWERLDDATSSPSASAGNHEKRDSVAPRLPSFSSETLQAREQFQQQWPQIAPEALLQGPDPMLANNIYQIPANPANTYAGTNRPLITLMTDMPPYSHQAQDSFSSTNAAQFGGMSANRNIAASPLAAGVSPSSYYTQTPLSQQSTAPYQALQRRPSHAVSEVTSLSSGFGDGIIRAPAPAAMPGSTANSPQQQQAQYAARFSWMTQQQQQQQQQQQTQQLPAGNQPPSRQNSQKSNTNGRRETIYTETSEDQPARFRSVTSWVDQQTGRIHRVHQRGGDQVVAGGSVAQPTGNNPGIPGVHNPPPSEQSFGLMMDDEERPRRVDEVVAVGGGGNLNVGGLG